MAEEKESKPTPRDAVTKPKEIKSLGEVEIEFGDSRNRVFAWPPTMEVLRGHWLRENLYGDEVVEDLAGMPNIPGIRIRVDCGRGKAILFDPLSLPENRDLMERIQRVIKAKFRTDQGPAKTVERARMDDDELKTWIYWMARRVEAKQARVTAGKLPLSDDIIPYSGRIRIESYNSSARACKWREDFDRYIDILLSGARNPLPV